MSIAEWKGSGAVAFEISGEHLGMVGDGDARGPSRALTLSLLPPVRGRGVRSVIRPRRLDGLPAACKSVRVIGSIRHKALRDYWAKGQAKGLNAGWIRKLRRILAALEAADGPDRMNYPGSYFHPLKGDRRGRYSVRLTANVRVTFGWNDDGAADVDIEDYHR